MKKIILIISILLALGIAGAYAYVQVTLNRMPRTALPQSDEELGITLPRGNGTQGTDTAAGTAAGSPGQSAGTPGEGTSAGSAAGTPVILPKGDAVNIALFGLDRRNPDEASRSDTIIIASIDKTHNKIKITSLMRDLYVPIPGHGENRINAAYAFGGPALAIRTINSNFGLDIRNYAAIDFEGLEGLIDKVGGVEIDVKSNEVNPSGVNGPGLQVLNGKQALAYSRIRYVGNSDYERTQRQRTVLNQLYKKVKAQGITRLPGLIASFLPFVETSLSNGEILSLAMDAAKFDTEDLEQFRIPVDGTFTGQTIREMMVLVPNLEKNKIKLHEFIYGD